MQYDVPVWKCLFLLAAEALVEGGGDGLAVHVLTDEDELLHAVAVGVVPVALAGWDNEVVTVSGNKVYIAQFNEYKNYTN